MHVESTVQKDRQHVVVLPQGVGHEGRDTPTPCGRDELVEQQGRNAVPVEVVGYCEGHFRIVAVGLAVEAPDADDLVVDDGNECHAPAVVHGREVLHLFG